MVPSWPYIAFSLVDSGGLICAIVAYLRQRERTRSFELMESTARMARAGDAEAALWYEVYSLRARLDQFRRELSEANHLACDWEMKAERWRLRCETAESGGVNPPLPSDLKPRPEPAAKPDTVPFDAPSAFVPGQDLPADSDTATTILQPI